MKAVIFGGDGQVGQYLVSFFSQKNWEVIAPSHQEVELTDHVLTKKFIEEQQPTVVINTTAYHVVDECEKNPEVAIDVNLTAPVFLAKICEEVSARYVFFSTDYVFDGEKKKPYQENDQVHPLQMYGMTKAWAEQTLLYGYPKTLIIRTASVFGGQGSRAKKGNFIVNLLKQAESQSEIEVVDNQYMSPSYATDIAQALFQLVEKEQQGIFHLTNKGQCSWAALAQQVIQLTNKKIIIKPIVREQVIGQTLRPMFSALDISKLESLGITMPEWQDAVLRYLKEIESI